MNISRTKNWTPDIAFGPDECRVLAEVMLGGSDEGFRPGGNFFLGKDWYAPYVSEWSPESFYCVQREPLAFVSRRTATSRLGVRYQALRFNEASDPELESLTLEFNGFFNADITRFAGDFDQFLQILLSRRDWSELRLASLSEQQSAAVRQSAQARQLIVEEISENLTYWVDLNQIRQAAGGDYLATRSANTRQQLRRARRQIESECGPLRIEEAASVEEAISWLDPLAELHLARWRTDNALEGFNNPRFKEFHRKMIEQSFAKGSIQFLRLSAGQQVVAYLFNYVFDGRAYFVMGGVDYVGKAKFKPGLLTHWLAIEHNLAKGLAVYDFLNGSNRYKESLANGQAGISSIVLRRRTPAFVIEHGLRLLRGRFKKLGVAGRLTK